MLGRVFLLLCVVVVTGLAGDFAADTVGGESSFTVAGACGTTSAWRGTCSWWRRWFDGCRNDTLSCI